MLNRELTESSRLSVIEGRAQLINLLLGQLEAATPGFLKDNSISGISRTAGALTALANVMLSTEIITPLEHKKIIFIIEKMNINTLEDSIKRIYLGLKQKADLYKDPFALSDQEKLDLAGMNLDGFEMLKKDLGRSIEYIESKYPCTVQVDELSYVDTGYKVSLQIVPKV